MATPDSTSVRRIVSFCHAELGGKFPHGTAASVPLRCYCDLLATELGRDLSSRHAATFQVLEHRRAVDAVGPSQLYDRLTSQVPTDQFQDLCLAQPQLGLQDSHPRKPWLPLLGRTGRGPRL
jgi:hypothetical protein